MFLSLMEFDMNNNLYATHHLPMIRSYDSKVIFELKLFGCLVDPASSFIVNSIFYTYIPVSYTHLTLPTN